MSPASYLAAPPRVAAAIVAPTTTIVHVDWAIYGALIAGFLAVSGAIALLVVRVLQAWRDFKRFRRNLGRSLDQLAEAGERTAEAAAAAGDTTRLQESLAQLRTTLADFAVLRQAIAEATDTFGRFTAVYPRK
jgi:Flp pilus assembly protein TadB